MPLQRPLDYLRELAIDQLSESAGQPPASYPVSITTDDYTPLPLINRGRLVKHLPLPTWHLT